MQRNDQFIFEIGCGYRHYHTASYFMVLTGPEIGPRYEKMHKACLETLAAVQNVIRPGKKIGDIFDTQRRKFKELGFAQANTSKSSGYSMGATFPPTWVDPPMLIKGSSLLINENMTFFTHLNLTDPKDQIKMVLGEQVVVRHN